MLASTFRALREAGFHLGLNVGDAGCRIYNSGWFRSIPHPEDPSTWGYERICRELGYRRCLYRPRYDPRVFEEVLKALRILVEAEEPPPELELGNVCMAHRLTCSQSTGLHHQFARHTISSQT